jgi:hypothetical protein
MKRVEVNESVAALRPDLAAEWHPTKNKRSTPADFRPKSQEKVWWLCGVCDHAWQTQVYLRSVRGTGCPGCWQARRGVVRSTPKPGQSFADVYPEVAKEWHPTRNENVKPSEVRPASQKKVWWQCEFGHEWHVAPGNRQRGERCPECAKRLSAVKRSTPKPGESLADLYPHYAAEWHPTNNASTLPSEVNPGSKQKRWWKCSECGGAWQTDPDHRTRRGDGCPHCKDERLSRTKSKPKPGESLAEKQPELAAEWHPTLNSPLTPFDVRPRGNASAWWQCPLGHVWRAKIAPRAVGIGCPQCSVVGVSEREVRLAHELEAAGLPVVHDHPRITVGVRRPVQADIVVPSMNLIVEYDGSYFHADKAEKDQKQTSALTSAGWTVVRVREKPLESLGGQEVFIASTDPIKSVASKVLRKLKRMKYQIDRCDEYTEDPEVWAERRANLALNKIRTRSLATEHPKLARQFDLEANNGTTPEAVHPGSMTKYWWRCEVCDYRWRASVRHRISRGCKPCGVRKRTKARQQPEAGQSFADLFPDVAKEWHPTLNGDLLPSKLRPYSNELVWWKCKRGHEWQKRVSSRREYGRCRQCGKLDGTLRRKKPPRTS